jgi:hypothetical protein
VWQSERNFQASTASALGLCAASSVARMEPWNGNGKRAGLASPSRRPSLCGLSTKKTVL